MLVAALALLPLWMLVAGGALARLATAGNTVQRKNATTARSVATAWESAVRDLHRQEATLGTAIGTRGQPNWGWTNGLLDTAVARDPVARNMSWVTAQGTVLASTVPSSRGTRITSGLTGQVPAGDASWISNLLQAGPISREVSVVSITVIREGGQTLGMLLTEIDPDNMGKLFPPETGMVAIFDRQGVLTAGTPPRAGEWESRGAWRESDPLLRRALAERREVGGATTPSTIDAPMLAVYLPDPETGYIVGALMPSINAYGPIVRHALWSLGLLLLASLLVGLIAYGIGGAIADPVSALRKTVDRLDRRQPTEPMQQSVPIELHALHDEVTAMAGKLTATADNSEQERELLQGLMTLLPVGVRFVTADGVVRVNNLVARDLLGEDALGVGATPRGRYTLHRLDGAPLPMTDIPLLRALHEGQGSRNVEVVIRYESRESLLALVSTIPVAAMDGVEAGVIEVIAEIVSDAESLRQIMATTDLEGQFALAQATLDTLLDLLPVGVFLLDEQGKIIRVNAEGALLWGGVIPAVTTPADFRFFHGWWTAGGEAIRAEEWPAVRALTANETHRHERITLNRVDGLRADVLSSAAPLHAAQQGAVIGAIWILQEV